MRETANVKYDLINLVRKVLPACPTKPAWDVRLVDRFDAAGAEPEQGIVRIHKNWLKIIHEPGLAHVTRHYLLAVEPFSVVDPREVMERYHMQWRQHLVLMSKAVTIEREWQAGRFTGNLIAGHAFIARVDESEVVAHWLPTQAVATALTAARSRQRFDARRLLKLRRDARSLLDTLASNPKYAHVDLSVAPYAALLPMLSRYRRTPSIPFLILKGICYDQIPSLDRQRILKLLLQLGYDVAEQSNLFDKLLDEFLYTLDAPGEKLV
ncbi:hypothetical protein [Tardiphaga sp.]|uniref:hypothetical protein n=1 Tax=Tardiphaga sp. TaxID=1926292 RepID=UPI00352AF585